MGWVVKGRKCLVRGEGARVWGGCEHRLKHASRWKKKRHTRSTRTEEIGCERNRFAEETWTLMGMDEVYDVVKVFRKQVLAQYFEHQTINRKNFFQTRHY